MVGLGWDPDRALPSPLEGMAGHGWAWQGRVGPGARPNLHSHFVSILKSPKKSEVTILLFCNHGRHRSVGMSRALEWCLAEQGCAVETEHLGKFFGAWARMNCEGTCSECTATGPNNIQILNTARKNFLNSWHRARDGCEKDAACNYHLARVRAPGPMPGPRAPGSGPGPVGRGPCPVPRARAPRVAIPVASQPNR